METHTFALFFVLFCSQNLAYICCFVTQTDLENNRNERQEINLRAKSGIESKTEKQLYDQLTSSRIDYENPSSDVVLTTNEAYSRYTQKNELLSTFLQGLTGQTATFSRPVVTLIGDIVYVFIRQRNNTYRVQTAMTPLPLYTTPEWKLLSNSMKTVGDLMKIVPMFDKLRTMHMTGDGQNNAAYVALTDLKANNIMTESEYRKTKSTLNDKQTRLDRVMKEVENLKAHSERSLCLRMYDATLHS